MATSKKSARKKTGTGSGARGGGSATGRKPRKSARKKAAARRARSADAPPSRARRIVRALGRVAAVLAFAVGLGLSSWIIELDRVVVDRFEGRTLRGPVEGLFGAPDRLPRHGLAAHRSGGMVAAARLPRAARGRPARSGPLPVVAGESARPSAGFRASAPPRAGPGAALPPVQGRHPGHPGRAVAQAGRRGRARTRTGQRLSGQRSRAARPRAPRRAAGPLDRRRLRRRGQALRAASRGRPAPGGRRDARQPACRTDRAGCEHTDPAAGEELLPDARNAPSVASSAKP